MNFRAIRAWIEALVFENIGLKLLALFFALVLYVFSHGAKDAQRTFAVDVVALLPAETEQRVLMTPLPQIRVTVAGSRALVDDLRSEDFGALKLDLRSGEVGHVDLDPSMFHIPLGAQVTQIDPGSIALQWEDEITRDIPIQASITGQPAPGFVVLGAPIVEPRVVQAKGPRSLVEPIQFARADAFDITNLDHEASFTRKLAIDRPPSRVSYDVQTVDARIDVARESLMRRFVRVPVEVVGGSRGFSSPREVDVEVKGPPETVNALRANQILPFVDLRELNANLASPGSAMAQVKVELEGCSVQVIPKKVMVRW